MATPVVFDRWPEAPCSGWKAFVKILARYEAVDMEFKRHAARYLYLMLKKDFSASDQLAAALVNVRFILCS